MMSKKLRLGLVQMTSARSHAPNIAVMEQCAAQAKSQKCDMLALPEVAGALNARAGELGLSSDEQSDPYVAACQNAARKHGLWIHSGSTPLAAIGSDKLLNHSNLINAQGEIVAAYDKIHLFDYHPKDAPPLIESRRYAPGQAAVLGQSPWGAIGMTICYDLRFPALYRDLAKAGATILMVPSAFTVATGRAHWATLLRARAIECGAFVVAAAQVGQHEDGRKTYGHGLVVDPWGEVLLDMGEDTGLAVVDIDLAQVDEARQRIPALTHDRNHEITLVKGTSEGI